MLAKFTAWLLELVVSAFKALGSLLYDIGVKVLDAILSAVAALITAVPAPSFLSQYSISSLIGQLPADVLYFVSALRLTEAFALVAAGFAFRMTRKVVTLFQW